MGFLLLGVDSLIACIAIGMAIAVLFPVVRRRMALANGICGAALIAAAGVLLTLNVADVG